ncbi:MULTISPECIES: tail fiber protein [Aquimarina]|uniref:tail fiber protein n=1 Tax=Aquimarina TaxID=290174 RepID=UPI0011C3720C|nr:MULTISPECIES: tail fiber protein [Aquimarina]
MKNLFLLLALVGCLPLVNAQDEQINGNLQVKSNGIISANRGRLGFSHSWTDWNHTIYNNYLNIDSEGIWDGMKFNVYKGANFRVGPNKVSAFFINENGNIGVGTTNPKQKLEIFNSTAFNTNMNAEDQDHISLISNDPGNGGFFGGITWKTGERRRAAIAATREHTDLDYVGLAFFTRGTDGPGPIYESMRITRYGNVGIGTTTPDAKLTVNGNIHTKEVKVDLSIPAPDYVFKKEYHLLTIEEVQQHIKDNGHLPNIPSAKEMGKNGVELGIMNMKLLEKIEELTLYTINQEKQLHSQEERIKDLEEKLTLLLKSK